MAPNYASVAFTDVVKALQEQNGSRKAYARLEKQTNVDGLTEREIHFIQRMDSVYMASIGTNGFPYVQHRGGPEGFLRVIDSQTIGFADFQGNKQYISVGNIQSNPQVSLLLMDYARQARLKIYARAEIVSITDQEALLAQLDPVDYPHKTERIILLHIEAYDWNCPQHIVPRYTQEEIKAAIAPMQAHIARLEAQIAQLTQRDSNT